MPKRNPISSMKLLAFSNSIEIVLRSVGQDCRAFIASKSILLTRLLMG
ncbi:MAG: hypothetical protein NDF58_08075 [archaeon YNP-LCB-024-027]|nr:hypothetical protein [Candidatus Culexarchaeum yellowstonense]